MTAARLTMIIRGSVKEKKENGMGWKEKACCFFSFFLFSFLFLSAAGLPSTPRSVQKRKKKKQIGD